MGFAIVNAGNVWQREYSSLAGNLRALHPGESIVACEWDEALGQPTQVLMPEPDIETVRAEKIAQLHQWWDSHPGIEVADGVVLPIQESGRNTNSGSFNLSFTLIGLGIQIEVIRLVNVRDRTVTIPVSSALTAFNTFDAAYEPISQAWDDTMDALEVATTREQLNAVEMPV